MRFFFTTETRRAQKDTKFFLKICAFVPLWLFIFSVSAQTQDWDFYFTNIDEKPASIGLNLALHDTAPLADKPQCLWIILKFQQSDSIGFPLENENKTLNKLEDELEIFLLKKSETIYAGRTTGDGERYFYFYSKSLDSVDIFIEDFFKTYPLYKYKLAQRYDDKWEIYFDFLYPAPLDLQLIYNHRIVNALVENGDNPAIPRHIDHWMNFEKKKQLKGFVKELEEKNFIVEKTSVDKKYKTHSFALQISEENKTDLESIDNSVIQLFQLVQKYNGVYGGWETFVVKE